jgi:hypothetical protein
MFSVLSGVMLVSNQIPRSFDSALCQYSMKSSKLNPLTLIGLPTDINRARCAVFVVVQHDFAGENQINGTIPTMLGLMSGLKQLDLCTFLLGCD